MMNDLLSRVEYIQEQCDMEKGTELKIISIEDGDGDEFTRLKKKITKQLKQVRQVCFQFSSRYSICSNV